MSSAGPSNAPKRSIRPRRSNSPSGRLECEEGKRMDDRAFASATKLTNEIRDRRIGCAELLDFYLARAERHNPALNAIVVWQVDQARERARAADAALAQGERWGPLHGIPVTVKESFNVAGMPTTFGNPLWKDNIAAGNAFLIDRLLQAGAIVFGKTNVPYMLADAQSYNDIYGTTNNPWDPTRSPGGSSGGEAATLAAGLSGLGAAPPGIGDQEHHRLFMLLLRAATASRMRDEDFARQQEIAATLSDDDMSDRAAVARGATLPHRSWGNANETRTKLRYVWHEFFKRFDVLLTPVAATAAFAHDHNPDRDARVVPVNGKPRPYQEQLFWAGLPSLSYLPATAAPLGLTATGLPVGCQIIGAEGEDPTTIEFARLLAGEIGGFVAPPGYG